MQKKIKRVKGQEKEGETRNCRLTKRELKNKRKKEQKSVDEKEITRRTCNCRIRLREK